MLKPFLLPIVKQYQQKKFHSLHRSFFRDDFKGVQDISKPHFKSFFSKSMRLSFENIPSQCILFASDFTPSDVVEAKRANVKALVSLLGGSTSHAAIVAKANGIPFVTNINFEEIKFPSDNVVIVDGGLGSVIINPSEKSLFKYEHLCQEFHIRNSRLENLAHLPAEPMMAILLECRLILICFNETDALHQTGEVESVCSDPNTYFSQTNKFPTSKSSLKVIKP